jgi:hypothetical protein
MKTCWGVKAGNVVNVSDGQELGFLLQLQRKSIQLERILFITWKSMEKIWFALPNCNIGTYFQEHIPFLVEFS